MKGFLSISFPLTHIKSPTASTFALQQNHNLRVACFFRFQLSFYTVKMLHPHSCTFHVGRGTVRNQNMICSEELFVSELLVKLVVYSCYNVEMVFDICLYIICQGLEMIVETAYRRSIDILIYWIHTEVNMSKTRVFFRTYAPVHFRFLSLSLLISA